MALDRADMRQVSPALYARLKRWTARKPCVALMGEFSAGKSTLLNFLIEAEILPTRVTATELPPIWCSYGKTGSHWIDQEWNRHPLNVRDIFKVPVDARYARIFVEAEILESCDVIDTPGISDPNLASESWRLAAGLANMVLWCTTATQAWRETERGTWLSLPERLRRHSILVVTRADKLAGRADCDKVEKRLIREAGGLFSKITFLATMDATRAKLEMEAGAETGLWAESGAEALLDAMANEFEAIGERKHKMFARYTVQRNLARPALLLEGATDPAADEGDGTVQPIRPARFLRAEPAARPQRPKAEDAAALNARIRAGLVDEVRMTPEPEPEIDEIDEIYGDMPAPDEAETVSPPLRRPKAGLRAEPRVEVREETRSEPLAAEAEPPVRRRAELPVEVAIWREIVARAPDDASFDDLTRMIEELLARIYSPVAGSLRAGAEAKAPDQTQPSPSTPPRNWRRLA